MPCLSGYWRGRRTDHKALTQPTVMPMPRRPLSSPATPAVAAVTQARWAVSIVASRCAGCAAGVEAGQRHVAVRAWQEGELRARTTVWCEKCASTWNAAPGIADSA